MVQAIGSSTPGGGFATGPSAGLLEAQLARYQTQLADWCNCPSGKTPEGQKIIQQLQDKADAVKTQLDRIASAKVQPSVTAGQPATTAGGSASTTALPSSPGNLLDTFA